MWLVLEDDRGVGLSAVRLPEGDFLVGRGPDCHLVLTGERISRKHVCITCAGGRVTWRDLGSTTGTLHEGAKSAAGELAPGQRLTLARRTLRLEREVTEELLRGPEPSGATVGLDWRPFGAFLERLRRAGSSEDLVARLLDGLMELFRAQRGFVLLPEAEGGRLVPVLSRGIQDAAAFVAVSSTVYGRALQTGRVVFVEDSSRDETCRLAASLAPSEAARSIACAPLVAGGASVGVLYLDLPVRPFGLEREQLDLLETVAGLAAELLAGNETGRKLLAARGRLSALSALAAGGDALVLGEGPAATALKEHVQAAAPLDVTVLVTGETGTGKEMVARAVHRASARRDEPFVAVDCGALPRDLVAAELFGAERGAYTGAAERRVGRFELAAGGTLFLDEIGDLPLEVQSSLLRVLQEKTVTRLGGGAPVPVDFRLVCATNVDLERAVREGSFRGDLFYRINVFRIALLPLRERPDDVLPLARHFLARFAQQFRRQLRGLSPEAERLLLAYPWPGNVRELRNAVERAVVLERGDLLQPSSLPFAAPPPASPQDAVRSLLDALPQDYQEAKNLFERTFLERVLEANPGNIAAAARQAGMSRCAIYRRLEALGLTPPEVGE